MKTTNNTADNMSTTQTIDLGNNESSSCGVYQNSDGTYTALTFTASKQFKTLGGARRWFTRRDPVTAAQLW